MKHVALFGSVLMTSSIVLASQPFIPGHGFAGFFSFFFQNLNYLNFLILKAAQSRFFVFG